MRKLSKIALIGLASVAVATPAFADTTGGDFDGFANAIETWLTGSLGKTIGLVGLGVGAVQAVRQAWASAFAFVAIGLLLSIGPGVMETMFGAVV